MIKFILHKILTSIKEMFYPSYKFMKDYFHFIEVILIMITFMLCALLG